MMKTYKMEELEEAFRQKAKSPDIDKLPKSCFCIGYKCNNYEECQGKSPSAKKEEEGAA